MATHGATTSTIQCPRCGLSLPGSFQYCDNCGLHLLDGAAQPAAPARPAPDWVSSTWSPEHCPACGGTDFSAEGFCDGCGQRRPTSMERSAFDLGTVAGSTDIGHRHQRNEDAMAIGTLPGVALAIVCDGVSSSSRGDAASHAAVDAAMPTLRSAIADGMTPSRALQAAAAAARSAVVAVSGPDNGNPPSCTYVAAVVTAQAVTIGWIGDSRAYWIPDGTPEGAAPDPERMPPACLTTDDSLAAELISTGVPPAEAHANPQAGALVRWIGVDADDRPAKTVTIAPRHPGRLVVCSDGLSRYRPGPAELAADTPTDRPLPTAQQLVRLALDAGGVDNVTVVVVPFPPGSPTGARYTAQPPAQQP